MSEIVGGIRARLIYDSIYYWTYEALEALGWFDSGRKHGAIRFDGGSVDADEEIPLNTLALTDEDLWELEAELGSNMSENRWTFYLDFFAESDVLGKEMVHDLRDILGGRMSSIGRDKAHVPVYDYRLATPTIQFYVDIEDLVVDRARDFPKPWQKHWFALRFDVVDSYTDEAAT